MWAVWNPDIGLYIGTGLTRKEMIEHHVASLGYDWDFHEKLGDRVVRVLVSPILKTKSKKKTSKP